MERRTFLELASGIAGVAGLPSRLENSPRSSAYAPHAAGSMAPLAGPASDGAEDRKRWVALLTRVAEPVLTHIAAGTLRRSMPVEAASGRVDVRRHNTHLEAVGRLLAGLAPWLELPGDDTEEGRLRARYADLARLAIQRGTDPRSPDRLRFNSGGQALVDAAFLAHATLRAPTALWQALDRRTRDRLTSALASTRVHLPAFNNWLLFSAIVEAALYRMGADWDGMRVDYAIRQHEQWYAGDGLYADGPGFRLDYYNSFVIQPMLIDVLAACGHLSEAWTESARAVVYRARRYGGILERLVAPDGSFPAVGRSMVYRCAAFQLLAQIALRHELPREVTPGQARAVLTAVIRRTLEPPGTFDEDGWLTIGLCGHQPNLGESYISTGSLYLCATAFLPLGLPPSDDFWTSPPAPWTSQRAWSGQMFPIDYAI